ncbi:MAG: hypothetical protein CMG00_08675 [Candidatus Marinimicrobia bacterium]|nr:hypothetical protein [Candidatus Neomarinimicrobiota bacterium]|tara:strand:- start:4965 stop:7073 length:2109 start_codon:yes stop_codon:yes gene_type:complete
MKFFVSVLTIMGFLLFSKDISIDVITTNDLHGSISDQKAVFMNPSHPPDIVGGAGLYKYSLDVRNESSSLLLFDSGNFFQGNPLGMYSNGEFIIDWMNTMDYSALVPGQYDFILGQEVLNELADKANFPFIMSNLKCTGCALKSSNIKDYIIKEIDGLKIGVLGIVNTQIPELVPSANIFGIEFVNGAISLQKWVPELKGQGVDVIILLTSSGVPWDREEEYNKFDYKIKNNLIDPYSMNLSALELGRFANGIDIIVSGGFSKGYDSPWYDPNSHVYTFQNYGNGTGFGHFTIKIDKESKLFKGYETAVDGKVGQTLLSDDFDIDLVQYEMIKEQKNLAIEKKYSKLEFKEKENRLSKNILKKTVNYDVWDIQKFGSDNNLEIMTWNCEFFPAAGDSTIKAMSEIINDIDVDVIAFQEIKKLGWFEKLVMHLPQYDYVVSYNSSFFDQAYIYKKDLFKLLRQVEPFSENDYNFAGRPPLRLDLLLTHQGLDIPISLINLHMKCCDSGLQRRIKASEMLYDYLDNEIKNYSYTNFIVLGDWNDDLKDNLDEHCFGPFLNDNRFYFATDFIDNDLKNASYPKEPYISFLDHILTVSDFIAPEAISIETVFIEDFIGGFEMYETLISDHRPILLSIPFNDIKNNIKPIELMKNELTGKKQVVVVYNNMTAIVEEGDKIGKGKILNITNEAVLFQTKSKLDTLLIR